MKGTYFQQPLEFNLLIDGESWLQGETIKGHLKVKNHGNESMDISPLGVQLAWGEARKIKKKSNDSFAIKEEIKFKEGEALDAHQEKTLDWEFPLSEDCPITEKNASFYMLYGNEEGIWQGGQLHLNVLPHKMISEMFHLFETFFRFKVKEFKSKKGFIDAKIVPPSHKEYMSIKSLNCQIKTTEKDLEIKFLFKLNKLNYVQNDMGIKEIEKTIEKTLGPKDYLIYGKDVDHQKVQKLYQSVLDEVKSTNNFWKETK